MSDRASATAIERAPLLPRVPLPRYRCDLANPTVLVERYQDWEHAKWTLKSSMVNHMFDFIHLIEIHWTVAGSMAQSRREHLLQEDRMVAECLHLSRVQFLLFPLHEEVDGPMTEESKFAVQK